MPGSLATPSFCSGDLLQSGRCLRPQVPPGMLYVPAGRFKIPRFRTNHNRPPILHPVAICRSFCIDKTEVTVEAYARCVAAGKCPVPVPKKEASVYYRGKWKKFPPESCNWHRYQKDKNKWARHPITCVNWPDAVAYCRYLKKRLPTNLQWERAARGTDGRLHPWGNERPNCWRMVYDFRKNDGKPFFGCGKGTTWPVCSKTSGNSPEGACDLSGNVSEWIRDGRNPRKHWNRWLRGSSWHGFWSNAGDTGSTGQRLPHVGVRCVVDK